MNDLIDNPQTTLDKLDEMKGFIINDIGSTLSIIKNNAIVDESDTQQYEDTPEDFYIDVRLNVILSSNTQLNWAILDGDASFDTDHRGFWASGCLLPSLDDAGLKDLATELFNDVCDDVAQQIEV